MGQATEYYTIRRVGGMTPDIRRMDRRLFPDTDLPDKSEWWEVRNPKGELVAFAAAEVHGRLVHLTRCGVRRADRGRRLQRVLIRVRERWGRRKGCVSAVTYANTTSYASLNSLLASGYRFTSPSIAGIDIRAGGPFVALWRPLRRPDRRGRG